MRLPNLSLVSLILLSGCNQPNQSSERTPQPVEFQNPPTPSYIVEREKLRARILARPVEIEGKITGVHQYRKLGRNSFGFQMASQPATGWLTPFALMIDGAESISRSRENNLPGIFKVSVESPDDFPDYCKTPDGGLLIYSYDPKITGGLRDLLGIPNLSVDFCARIHGNPFKADGYELIDVEGMTD